MQRFSFRVTGRVQGVGFRWFVLEVARRFQLVGWVENRRDGSVHGEAQGTAEALERLIGELRRGPGFSRVDDVDVQQLPLREDSEAEHLFEIR